MKGTFFSTRVVVWVIMAAVLVGVGGRMNFLHSRTDFENSGLSKSEKKAPKEDSVFFSQLVENDLVYPVNHVPGSSNSSQLLEFVPSDYYLKLERVDREGMTEEEVELIDRRQELAKTLHSSIVGLAVRKAVLAWNEAHTFAGIRDNRPESGDGPETRWQARDFRYSRQRVKQNSDIPWFCAFVTGGKMIPGFGEWLRAYNDDTVRFTTTVTVDKPTELIVQVVGEVLDFAPVSIKKENTPRTVAGRAFKRVHTPSGNPGREIIFDLPAGSTELSVDVRPVEFRKGKIPGLNVSWDDGESWPEGVKWMDLTPGSWRAPSAHALYTADGVELCDVTGEVTDAAWDLGLTSLTGVNIKDGNSLQWVLSEGAQDGEARLTIDSRLQKIVREELDNGVNGFWNSTDQFARLRRGGAVILDADTGEILAAASYPSLGIGMHLWDLNAFSSYYHARNWRTFRPWQGIDAHSAPGSTFKPVTAMAAIKTVQDDGPQADRIRSYMEGLKTSDFKKESGLALSTIGYDPANDISFNWICENNDPTKCNRWYVYKSDNSTKRVHEDFAELVEKDKKYKGTKTINNYNRYPLSRLVEKKQNESGVWVYREIFGLEQAVRESANVWFVKLAEIMDGTAARGYDEHEFSAQDDLPWPALGLGEYSRKLGFGGEKIDLLSNARGKVMMNRKDPNDRKWGEGDVLFAHPGELVVQGGRKDGFLQTFLAQNSIGQASTSTPLQMARVAAAISTNVLPHPYLLTNLNGDKLDATEGLKLEFEAGLWDKGKEKVGLGNYMGLDLLKSGMKAVVNNGTASKAFKKHPDRFRTFGKTGTANVGLMIVKEGSADKEETKAAYNSAWFMGWREPDNSGQAVERREAGEPGQRRLAFACFVSHAYGKGHNGGGSVAAPIVARILERAGNCSVVN